MKGKLVFNYFCISNISESPLDKNVLSNLSISRGYCEVIFVVRVQWALKLSHREIGCKSRTKNGRNVAMIFLERYE